LKRWWVFDFFGQSHDLACRQEDHILLLRSWCLHTFRRVRFDRSRGDCELEDKAHHVAWLLREPTIYTLIETTIVDAAHRRGELALGCGDVAKAKWAAEKGLAIVDGQEAMYRMKMKAASDAGDLDGVNAAYREAQRAAESYGYDDEVQPETQELYEELAKIPRSS